MYIYEFTANYSSNNFCLGIYTYLRMFIYIYIYIYIYMFSRTTSRIFTIRRIVEAVRAKNLEAKIIFVDVGRAFKSIHRRKMEQVLLAYGLPKETVAAITMLYRHTKVKVRSPEGDTDDFDIVTGVLQGDTLAPHLFIIWLDYVLKIFFDKMKDIGFNLTKERNRRYPAHTITDADYADHIAFLANTPAQAKNLQHSLERTAAGMGFQVNADKTEYICKEATSRRNTFTRMRHHDTKR